METMKDRTALVGIGYTTQGKVPGRSSLSFHVEAARNAIEDAGLEIDQVDGLLIQPQCHRLRAVDQVRVIAVGGV